MGIFARGKCAFVWLASDVRFAAGWLLMVLMAAAGFWRAKWPANVSMYAYIGDQILSGARPYVEIVDINPPLIAYIHAGAAWCARGVHADSLLFFQGAVLVAAAGGSLLAYFSLRDYAWAWASGLGFFLATVFTLYTFQFGEREHLFALALVPYLSCRWGRAASPFLLGTAAFAGLFACFKPGFGGILLLFEVLHFWKEREKPFLTWSALVLPPVCYLVHLLIWNSQSKAVFWGQIVPEVMKYYSNYNMPSDVIRRIWLAPLSIGFAYGAACVLAGFRRNFRLLSCGVLIFAAFAYAVGQGKGWDYHLITGQVLLAFTLPILLAECAGHLPQPKKLRSLLVAIAALPAAWVAGQSIYHYSRLPEFSREAFSYPEIRAIARPGDSVVIFSITVNASYPLIRENGLRLGSRYAFMFPLAFFRREFGRLNEANLEHLSAAEQGFVNTLRADFIQRKPDLLIFPRTLPNLWDYQAWPFFALPYAEKVGIFQATDPSYQLVLDNDKLVVFRRREGR